MRALVVSSEGFVLWVFGVLRAWDVELRAQVTELKAKVPHSSDVFLKQHRASDHDLTRNNYVFKWQAVTCRIGGSRGFNGVTEANPEFGTENRSAAILSRGGLGPILNLKPQSLNLQ